MNLRTADTFVPQAVIALLSLLLTLGVIGDLPTKAGIVLSVRDEYVADEPNR